MQEQNLKNHARMVPLYHYLLLSLVLVFMIASFVNLYQAFGRGEDVMEALMFCLLAFIVLLASWFTRAFALKAQDRAIRAEENLRYFAMTGKLLDNNLTTRQIVALRFAPNNEFADLAHKAVEDNMTAREIKEAIKNWKPDHYRV